MTVIASVPLFQKSTAFFTSGSAGHIKPIVISPRFFGSNVFLSLRDLSLENSGAIRSDIIQKSLKFGKSIFFQKSGIFENANTSRLIR